MKPEDARKELVRVFGDTQTDENGIIVGTPELRAKFYYIDEWHNRFPDFNPVKLVALQEEGGYDWSFYAVFRNANRAFVYVHGSGCSCNGPGESCSLDFFKNVDQLTTHLNHLIEKENWGDEVRNIYHQVLTYVATKGRRAK